MTDINNPILSASYHLSPPNDTTKNFEIGDTVTFTLLESAGDTETYNSVNLCCITHPSFMMGIINDGKPKTYSGGDSKEYRFEINQIANIDFTYAADTTKMTVSILVDQAMINVLNYLKKNMGSDDELHMWVNDITGIQKDSVEYGIDINDDVGFYGKDTSPAVKNVGNNYYQELIVGVSGKSKIDIDSDFSIKNLALCGTYTQKVNSLYMDDGNDKNMIWGTVNRASDEKHMPVIANIPNENFWAITFCDTDKSSNDYSLKQTYVHYSKPGDDDIGKGILVTGGAVNKTWTSVAKRRTGPVYAAVYQPSYKGSGDNSGSTIAKNPLTGLWAEDSTDKYESNYVCVAVKIGDKDADALTGIYIRNAPGGGSFKQCVGDGSDGITAGKLEYNSSEKRWELKDSDDTVHLYSELIDSDDPVNETEPFRYGWWDGSDIKTGFGVVVCTSMLPFNITDVSS